MGKSAIFAPTLLLVLQMIPLYMLTGKKYTFCTFFVTGYCPLYSLIVDIASVWPHFTTGPPNGLSYSLILEIAIFWPHVTTGPPDGPPYRLIDNQ